MSTIEDIGKLAREHAELCRKIRGEKPAKDCISELMDELRSDFMGVPQFDRKDRG